MTRRLIDFLLHLTPRERGLVAGLVFAALPLALIFGLLLPLADHRRAAERARDEAVALDDWVRARAAEAQVAGPATQPPPGAPIGLAAIERGLIEAGLRPAVSALDARGDAGIELLFDRVDFQRLANWLSDVHPGWGYDLDSYRFEPTDRPGLVSAAVVLSPG